MKKERFALEEEILNIISHSIGILFFIIGFILLLIRAHSAIGIITSILYSIISIYYYIFSCITHSINIKNKKTNSFEELNITNQIILFASIYTPITICKIDIKYNWILLIGIWSIALLFIVFIYNNYKNKPKTCIIISLLLYWITAILITKNINNLTIKGLELTIISNLLYSIGIFMETFKKNYKFRHTLYHIYTLINTILYYFFIYLYII